MPKWKNIAKRIATFLTSVLHLCPHTHLAQQLPSFLFLPPQPLVPLGLLLTSTISCPAPTSRLQILSSGKLPSLSVYESVSLPLLLRILPLPINRIMTQRPGS